MCVSSAESASRPVTWWSIDVLIDQTALRMATRCLSLCLLLVSFMTLALYLTEFAGLWWGVDSGNVVWRIVSGLLMTSVRRAWAGMWNVPARPARIRQLLSGRACGIYEWLKPAAAPGLSGSQMAQPSPVFIKPRICMTWRRPQSFPYPAGKSVACTQEPAQCNSFGGTVRGS